MPDVDIDLADREQLLKLIKHTPARLNNRKHNTGVYTHRVPVNPFNGFCSIDYKEAENNGYFKLDLLNVSLYKDVKNDEHLNSLLEKEPIWELLEHKEFVEQLFHLNGHMEILEKTRPTSVEQLAAVLAMIRPAKKHLVGKTWNEILDEVWTKPEGDAYYFKKAHSFSYALAVIVHMNLLCEQIMKE